MIQEKRETNIYFFTVSILRAGALDLFPPSNRIYRCLMCFHISIEFVVKCFGDIMNVWSFNIISYVSNILPW